ncbi:MAG: AAA family ATPase [Planctomycetes bacterium]|nr:AAA family ATPase [Planctomycetota bacterium]
MITDLDIKGFKSINDLHLDCRRINLFIGEPNTGKSNILEALGLLSYSSHGQDDLHDYIRYENPWNFFHIGENAYSELTISLMRENKRDPVIARCRMDKDTFTFSSDRQKVFSISAQRAGSNNLSGGFNDVKFYRYKSLEDTSFDNREFLVPPCGCNLTMLLTANKELRDIVTSIIEPSGFMLLIKPVEKKLEIQRFSDGAAFGLPFDLVSDTLKRYIFHIAAIESNKDSAIVFEEPESHAFPYYTKHLGERIALDNGNNQFFVATHNIYLASAIIEKAKKEDVAVFVTYLDNFETKAKHLSKEELDELFEGDPFLGLNSVLEEE